ncbi:hypothetical protein DMO24_19190, partial [Modestobacter versicolor]
MRGPAAVAVPVEGLLGDGVRLGVGELRVGCPRSRFGELVGEQPDVVGVRRARTGQPQPRLGDVRVDVERPDVDGAGHPLTVVVVEGEPVLLGEQVVLDLLDLRCGEPPSPVPAVDVGGRRHDVGDVVGVGPDHLVGPLGPDLGTHRAGRPHAGPTGLHQR